MTQRQILELAAWLAEHGAMLQDQSRGIPVSALRRYLKSSKAQCQNWSQGLASQAMPIPAACAPPDRAASRLAATIEEIAVHGVLVRVTSSLFYAIGDRLDIPLARDVAKQTVRGFENVIEQAMASVALCGDITARELCRLDGLGMLCDRLSDLLCGTLWPHLRCDRFAVDRERVADFAGTFGQRPALVRVPIRRAATVLSGRPVSRVDLAADMEQSLLKCFPALVNWRTAAADEFSDLREMFTPRILRLPEAAEHSGSQPPPGPAGPPIVLAFPTCSFVRMLRKVHAMRRPT